MFYFFQAEDSIRCDLVTGVQTCALPIFIISDVRMPGMSGREFLERLGRDRPDLVPRVVLSTGDTFAPDTAALLKESGVPTVTKPFDFAMLELVLREVATRAAAGRPQAAGR